MRLNQASKENYIQAHILLAFAGLHERGIMNPSVLELFCADGYFGLFAKRFGADVVRGIDNDKDGHLHLAHHFVKALGYSGVDFFKQDVAGLDDAWSADLVINAGGLYHVDNPEEVLHQSYSLANHYLVIQTVVTTAVESDSYFQAPAPGWTWGNRYSEGSFKKLLFGTGWKVEDYRYSNLLGNIRLEDRGSVFALVSKS